MTNPEVTVSIILPTHDRMESVLRTIDFLAKVHIPADTSVELVVVANDCSDNTGTAVSNRLKRFPAKGKVVTEPVPGLNVARNRGMQESSGELCLFIDDDISMDENWLSEILVFFRKTEADCAGGRVDLAWHLENRPDWFSSQHEGLLSRTINYPTVVELQTFSGIIGANFWIRRKVWERIGGFRPDLDRCGSSKMGAGESEFLERAKRNGFRLFYCPNGKVDHWVAPTRITRPYLLGVARGNGRGRVVLKDSLSLTGWLRTAAGHFYLMVFGAAMSLVLAISKPTSAVVGRHEIFREIGIGGLAGLWQRLTRRGQ